MQGSSRSSQRGISFLGLLFVGVVLASVFLVGLKVLPTYIEYMAIEKAVKRASENSTVAAVQADFDRAASIDQIESITGKDLDITKDGDQVVVSFSYQKELPLFGPAYLLLKYSGRSR